MCVCFVSGPPVPEVAHAIYSLIRVMDLMSTNKWLHFWWKKVKQARNTRDGYPQLLRAVSACVLSNISQEKIVHTILESTEDNLRSKRSVEASEQEICNGLEAVIIEGRDIKLPSRTVFLVQLFTSFTKC